MARENIELQATKRSVIGKQVKALRREGKLPAVIYGKHIEPVSIMLESRDTTRTLSKVGTSHLIQVNVDGEKYTVLVRDRQRNFIKGGLVHVDFLAVSMTEKLRTEVRLEFAGTSPAVSDLGGILVSGITEVEIECLPGDLMDAIHVDVSVLKRIGSSLLVKDLDIPANVTLLTNPQEMVVQVVLPAGEESVVAAAEVTIEPDILEKGKKEKEED
ncbi:MAG: 50S ribosomal protein L25 [Chloroflexota bacterium]